MAYPSNWLSWAQGVLVGIGAPVTAVNLDNLWAWTSGETPLSNPMRINNPLNTTQPEPGATNFNSAGVKQYPTVATGIAGTRDTLLNGYYPALVQALRSNVPHTQWSTAVQANITKWGTGLGWVKSTSPAPSGGAKETVTPITPADPFGINAFGQGLSHELTGIVEIIGGLVLILAGLLILVLMGVKGAAPAAAKVAELASPAGRALGAARGLGKAAGPAKAPAAVKAPAAAPVTKPAPAPAEYRAGGKVIEITPEARKRLEARQRGEAA
jgi:hypothetical protein